MKIKHAFLALLVLFIFSGCDDENPYTCSDCVDAPQANPAYNSTGQGIYKGVVVGSSGTIIFNIANDNATITATLILDNHEYELVTDGVYDAGGFSDYFYNDMGTEDQGDDINIYFWVNADASMYGIDGVSIPGHVGAQIQVIKELSTALVVAFEGTYSGAASGLWNMVMILTDDETGEWGALSHDGEAIHYSSGSMSESVITGEGDNGIVVVGTMTGDVVNGEWESSGAQASGTWKGRRTL